MKYFIIIIIIVGLLFGLQVYINNQSAPKEALIDTNTLNTQDTMAPSTEGFIIKDTVIGTGKEASATSTITVNYTGKFTDGKVFDSSIPRGKPFVFTLGEGAVIKGWDLGFTGMKEGGKRTLTIPAALGYGAHDYNGIPGGSTLIFDVELLKVE